MRPDWVPSKHPMTGCVELITDDRVAWSLMFMITNGCKLISMPVDLDCRIFDASIYLQIFSHNATRRV